ncbi:MAG: outer membrane beta-barrel domain-containing protein [Proteobacteria bacterium]|jgi:outer membrane beta-barrel protein|nr:outer membrane beta-barrel domain-containing protein [Pseudomonadota bacterium]
MLELRRFSLWIFLVIVNFSVSSWAQSADDSILPPEANSELDIIEQELEKNRTPQPAPLIEGPQADNKLENFTGLGTLAPFSEISVIQKRFLPKTGRFQAYGSFANVVNDPWFMGIGVSGRLAYYFTEAWGVEATGSFLSNSERQSAKDLYEEHRVRPDSFIHAKSYMGLAAIWTPIYGKTTLFNQRIIPFDMYFTAGAGSSALDGGTGGSTIHTGTGQIYAINKSMGFRWDLSWNFIRARATPKSDSGEGKPGSEGYYNNLILSAGISWFFPEAKYR